MSLPNVHKYRFEVALSFAGDGKRPQVRAVAELLRSEIGEDKVFFDEWFEAELAGHDAQVVLQSIYRNSTRLVVTCVCKRYNEKPWTQEEWRAIQAFERNLRDAGSENHKRMRLLPLRFGDGEVDGIFETAMVPDVRSRTAAEIARLILERLRLAKGSLTEDMEVRPKSSQVPLGKFREVPPMPCEDHKLVEGQVVASEGQDVQNVSTVPGPPMLVPVEQHSTMAWHRRLTYGLIGVGILGLAVLAVRRSDPEPPLLPMKLRRLNPACLPEEAYQTVESCPDAPTKLLVRPRGSAAFKSPPPPRATVQKEMLELKQVPEEVSVAHRNLHTTGIPARSRALLDPEIAALELLYERTPRHSSDLFQVLQRLAENYVELEAAATREMMAAIEAANAKQQAKHDQARGEESAAQQIVVNARENAIKYYTRMKNWYPGHSNIDETRYHLAYEYEQANDLDRARNLYLELIEKAPNSPYVPYAYLAFGEHFFVEGMGGDLSKWAIAESAYKEAIKYKPPTNKAYGYALYKLGHVYWNSGEYAQAIQEFKNVIEYGDAFADLSTSKLLQAFARRDILPPYAMAGKASKAYNFFRPLSGDGSDNQEPTLQMLRDLAVGYYDTGHYDQAITLYRDLMARDKSDYFCEYEVFIVQSVQALSGSDKTAIRKELDNMVGVYNRFQHEPHSAQSQLECANHTAELLVETAMTWHLESVGTGGKRGTNDPKTMDLAAYLYQMLTNVFTAEDFSEFTFPRIVREDWPSIAKIRLSMADLLYAQQRWEDCGPAFDAVVDEDPNSEAAAEAAHGAVFCYQKVYDYHHPGDSDKKSGGLAPTNDKVARKEGEENNRQKFKPPEFTPMQEAMIHAFNRYICYTSPVAENDLAQKRYLEVKYARARTYYEAQHWAEAAIAFRDIALNYADKDPSIHASRLYVESLNVIGSKSEPPKPACIDEIGKDVPTFLELFCAGDKYAREKESCDLLTRFVATGLDG